MIHVSLQNHWWLREKQDIQAENAKQAIEVNWTTENTWDTAAIEAMIKVGEGKPIEIQKEGKAKQLLELCLHKLSVLLPRTLSMSVV